MPKIYFVDVTNRDTVQAPRINLSKLQKTMVNMYLGQLGICQSEFGFPCLKSEQNYIRANLELQAIGAMGALMLSGWCRAVVADVKKAIETGTKDLNLSMSTSDQMIRHKFRGKVDHHGVIQRVRTAVSYARDHGVRSIGVNAEDASRSDLGYLVAFSRAAMEAGAQRIRYCDTLGYDTPRTIYERVKTLAEEVGIPLEVHCHNDLGMAVANSLAGAQGALDGGVDAYINGSANGLGERAGQADLLSCILAVKFGCGMENYEIGDPVNLGVAGRLADYVSHAFGIPIPINQPGVGANAFAHESGIHADGALKDRSNYELYDHELLGLDAIETPQRGRIITTGEFGGLAGFKHVFERLNVTLSADEEAGFVFDLVQRASAHNQTPLRDDELRFIAEYPQHVRTIIMHPEESYFLDFDATCEFMERVEEMERKVERYVGRDAVCMIAIEPHGPRYAQVLCDHIRAKRRDIVLASFNPKTRELDDDRKIERRQKFLLVDNDIITGVPCHDAIVLLESKGIPRDKIKVAVLQDRTGNTADFSCMSGEEAER